MANSLKKGSIFPRFILQKCRIFKFDSLTWRQFAPMECCRFHQLYRAYVTIFFNKSLYEVNIGICRSQCTLVSFQIVGMRIFWLANLGLRLTKWFSFYLINKRNLAVGMLREKIGITLTMWHSVGLRSLLSPSNQAFSTENLDCVSVKSSGTRSLWFKKSI